MEADGITFGSCINTDVYAAVQMFGSAVVAVGLRFVREFLAAGPVVPLPRPLLLGPPAGPPAPLRGRLYPQVPRPGDIVPG